MAYYSAILLSAFFSLQANSESVRSPEILSAACDALIEQYSNEDRYETPISQWGIEVDKESCEQMTSEVTNFGKDQIGTKEFVTSISFTMSKESFTCKMEASRSVDITLDQNDQPIWNVSNWDVHGQGFNSDFCKVNADPFLEALDFYSDSQYLTLLKSDVPKEVLNNSPEPMDLNEPDDGTYGDYSSFYEVNNEQGQLVGYVENLKYYNSEMESGSEYILKYNLQGNILGHLIEEANPLDFCEYLKDSPSQEDKEAYEAEGCE